MSIDGWLDIVRREAQHVFFQHQPRLTLVCTAYNKDIHAIKGILVPHGVETDWIALASVHAGNGFGILIGPKVGDPKKLDGDQFDIDFDISNPNRPIARHKQFSTTDKPPTVKSGEMLWQHSKGHHLFFDEKGNVTIYFNADKNKPKGGEPPPNGNGGYMAFDKDGNLTHNSHKKTLTLDDGAGATHVHDGKGNITRKAKKVSDTATEGDYTREASKGSIADKAKKITHNGPTDLNGATTVDSTLSVSQAISANGGLDTGALRVATDANGGLVEATMGLAVTGGAIADTLTVGGATITSGNPIPSAVEPAGSLYLRLSGSSGHTLYVSQGGGTWNPVAGV